MNDKAITKVDGKAIPIRGNEIDTDRIIPARYMAAITFEGMEEGHPKKLTLSLGTKNSKIFIDVSDTGPGISDENQRKIFEPFFSTKATGKGTGLGLSICHGIIQQHKGAIRVDSELGRGTRFSIELPKV